MLENAIVTLVLNGELYGIGIEFVRRALPPQPITPVPQMPPAARGVMNLRGRILPVIDLRARLGLPPLTADQHAKTRFLIVEADGRGAALITDCVTEVRRIPDTPLEHPSCAAECLLGIARLPSDNAEVETLVRLLDIRKTLDFTA